MKSSKKKNKSFLAKSADCLYDNREEIIDNYINGRLSHRQRQKFEEHFFICDICFQELQIRQEVATVLLQEHSTAEEAKSHTKTVDRRHLSLHLVVTSLKEYLSLKWLIPAAAIATIILLFVLGRNFFIQPNLEVQRHLFAVNSKPSPSMERLLNQTHRAEDVTVISPSNNDNVKKNLLFRWQREDNSELFIIILNNREEELFTFSTTGNDYLFKNAAKKLPPGLYYWKLEDENELKHVGKFYVDKPGS
ncbi:hypothetical protein JW998_08915 [candidate division KSB1 bacterium]|nr:hypothetical protein [candidate division KSB1 bacterium]